MKLNLFAALVEMEVHGFWPETIFFSRTAERV